VALTAWQALVDTRGTEGWPDGSHSRGLRRVGSFAIQIAKAHGAKVIATRFDRQPGLAEATRRRCGNRLHEKQNFENIAKDVDVVLDSDREGYAARSYGVVKKGGDHCFTRCAPGSGGTGETWHSRRGPSV